MLSILKDSQMLISEKICSLAKHHSFYLEGHSDTISLICISNDKSLLGTGSMSRSFHIWSTSKRCQESVFREISGGIHSIAISDSNKYGICGTGAKEVKVFNLFTKEAEHSFDVDSRLIWRLALVSDCKLIISAGITSSIYVYNFYKKVEVAKLKGHKSGITELLVINDRGLVSACFDGFIIFWDLFHMNAKKSFKAHSGFINQLLFFKQAGIVVSCSKDSTVKLWDLEQGQIVSSFLEHHGSVNSCSLNFDGTLMVTAAGDGVCVWDLRLMKMKNRTWESQRLVFFADFLENDTLIVSASSRLIKIWNRESDETIKNIEIPRLEFLKIVKFNGFIITACSDYSIKSWDQQDLKEFNFQGHLDYVSYLRVENDKVLVTGGKDGTVRIWNLREKKEMICLSGHKRFIKKIAFTKNFKFFVSASNDLMFCIWRNREVELLFSVK